MTTSPVSKTLAVQRGRNTSLPLSAFLTLKIAESGKTNTEIAEALGYPRPNVVAMLKTGNMRLPVNKVASMAKELDVDPVFLLEKVLNESAPELWDALRSILGDRLISKQEHNVVLMLRKLLDGTEVDLSKNEEFTSTVKPLVKAIAAREVAEAKGSIERAEREKYSATRKK